MNTSREVFEKKHGEQPLFSFGDSNSDVVDWLRDYVEYLESQNALMLEALKETRICTCASYLTEHCKDYTCGRALSGSPRENCLTVKLGNIINKVSGEQI